MNYISSCYAKFNKDYLVFENGKLSSTTLGLVGRFFRWLGVYSANTRLAVVAQVAHNACFDPKIVWEKEDKKRCLELFEKARAKGRKIDPYTFGQANGITYSAFIKDYHNISTHEITGYYLLEIENKIGSSAITLMPRNRKLFIEELHCRNDNDTTYPFLSKVLRDSLKAQEILFENHACRAGYASTARTYGFSGERSPEEKSRCEHGHEDQPGNYLKLSREMAEKFIANCPLRETASLDFLID